MDEKKEQHKNRQNETRILVVDDHAIVREGLALLINQKPDLSVCVEAESANQALDAVEKQRVDLAIINISLGSAHSVQLAEKIELRRPNLPVAILSMRDEVLHAERAGTVRLALSHPGA